MNTELNIERDLLDGLAKGERLATEQIYTRHYPTITKWIQNNGGTEPDAADIYQESMLILYEKAQQEEFRLSCKVGTYLFSISKHLWYKRLQQLQKQPGTLTDHDGDESRKEWAYEDDISAHKEREAYYTQLNLALEQLGEPCRSLLQAFYHKDKSMQEIAADFGYTNPDNAKTQKYKCLTRLKKIFYGVQAK